MRFRRLVICIVAVMSLTAGTTLAPVMAVFHTQHHVDFQNPPACCVWLVGENYAGTGVLQVTPSIASTDPSGFFACVGLGNSGASTPYSYNCYYGSGYGPYGSGNIQTMYENGEPYQINWIHGIDYGTWD